MTARTQARRAHKNPNRGLNGGGWIRRATRFAILIRDAWCCAYCALDLVYETATVDHLIPRSDGGTDHPTNLVAACTKCNYRRRDTSVLDFVRNHVNGKNAPRIVAQIFKQARRPMAWDEGKQLALFVRALKAVA